MLVGNKKKLLLNLLKMIMSMSGGKNKLHKRFQLLHMKLTCKAQSILHFFTVENETKETDNDNKIAETATTDAHIEERL